jgi:asparagine synthase (glutamine-hydrolysing)
MCGIFAILNAEGGCDDITREYIETQFKKGQKRGPEFSTLDNVMIKTLFGFHRLAINGLSPESNQPFYYNDVVLICNGEIYNYKELYEMMDVKPISGSDCEVIIHLYIKYGIEQTLQMIEGDFSFVLLDNRRAGGDCKIYVARDPYGVRPLYWLKPKNNCRIKKEDVFAFASELKVLYGLYNKLNNRKCKIVKNKIIKPTKYTVEQLMPGSYVTFIQPFNMSTYWEQVEQVTYHRPGYRSIMYQEDHSMHEVIKNVQMYLKNAVYKRCCTTERPIACLLSGGLDSSLITSLVNEFHKEHNLPQLETYSIGLEGATDLEYAQTVADYLGTKHTTVILTEDDFLKAIPEVIESIESYDTTTVRASIGNWLLGKYISEHSKAKVIFNGDGSDELTGGYLYMKCAGDGIEFDRECRRLLKDIHHFDVLRSDKSISSHGLEPRTPFLDRSWVDYYLSIPHKFRYRVDDDTDKEVIEKYILRQAFSKEHYLNRDGVQLLPDKVLWRRKEAFSDGVSKETRSLYTIIQEYADNIIKKEITEQFEFFKHIKTSIPEAISKIHPDLALMGDHLLPQTTEQLYYRQQFEKIYPGIGTIIPYFWMPKYIKATDASARTLKIYKTTTSNSAGG